MPLLCDIRITSGIGYLWLGIFCSPSSFLSAWIAQWSRIQEAPRSQWSVSSARDSQDFYQVLTEVRIKALNLSAQCLGLQWFQWTSESREHSVAEVTANWLNSGRSFQSHEHLRIVLLSSAEFSIYFKISKPRRKVEVVAILSRATVFYKCNRWVETAVTSFGIFRVDVKV